MTTLKFEVEATGPTIGIWHHVGNYKTLEAAQVCVNVMRKNNPMYSQYRIWHHSKRLIRRKGLEV